MASNNSNIKDVARRAGVSTATVSHVLNHTKAVSEETRRRVLKAVEGLQYQPNQQARRLRMNQRTDTFVLVEKACLENAAATQLFTGLVPELQQRGDSVITAFFERPEQMEAALRRGVGAYSAIYILSIQPMTQYGSLLGENVLFLNVSLENCMEYASGRRQIDLGVFFYRELEACLQDAEFSHIVLSYEQGKVLKKMAAGVSFEKIRLMNGEIGSGAYYLQQAVNAGGGRILFANHTLFLGAVKYLLQHEEILYTCDLTIEHLPWARQVETYGMPLAQRPLPMETMLRYVLAQPFPR